MPTREELLQIANAKANEAAAQQIANDYQANTQLCYEAAAQGKFDDAGYHWREMRRLEAEAAPYVAAAQQQQAQQQFTDVERELMRDYPQIVNDPKKWNTALAAANNLIMRGYDRNSGAYISAIAHACDITDANGAESMEVASPDEALRISQSKYGETSVDEYNRNVQRLSEMKKLGHYRNDRS